MDRDVNELAGPPRFEPGQKVQSTKVVKNDGTFLGRELGEVLVKKGEVGYVRDVGTFLQRYYIYAVEFIERGAVVGMRARELRSIEVATGERARP